MASPTIDIRPLASSDELRACVALQRETWGDAFSDAVPLSILKVSQRIGGIAAGAFRGGELVGFVFGLTGVERGRIVHWSDMLAVRPDARNLGLGRRLKEYQRHAVREIGGAVIYWTYDPLVARNAHLNFNRLGVRLAEYVDDMYGITDSPLHGGIATDRMVVAWPTRDEEIAERLGESERALDSGDCQQSPVVTCDWIDGADGAKILPHCVRVEIPARAERMLLESAGEALHWRESVRAAIRWCLGAGYTVSAFHMDEGAETGFYLMTKVPRLAPPARV